MVVGSLLDCCDKHKVCPIAAGDSTKNMLWKSNSGISDSEWAVHVSVCYDVLYC